MAKWTKKQIRDWDITVIVIGLFMLVCGLLLGFKLGEFNYKESYVTKGQVVEFSELEDHTVYTVIDHYKDDMYLIQLPTYSDKWPYYIQIWADLGHISPLPLKTEFIKIGRALVKVDVP